MHKQDSYLQILANPKWRSKRKIIFERDNYKCTVCKTPSDLEVHHTFYYKKKVFPWQYPNKTLLTLCHNCHYNYHITNEVPIKNNPPRLSKKRKKKQETHAKNPSFKDRKKARESIHPPCYKKKVNGHWFTFEVKYF